MHFPFPHHAMARGFGHRFGPRGGHFGRGFGGRDDMPRARKLSADELQLVILALLDEKPAHGYELIRLLEERSGGFYAPSPGMIYPALTYLDEIGHATSAAEGNRKLYSITDDGRAHLAAHREEVDRIIETLRRIGERMADVRDAFAGVNAADPESADILHRARHALKAAIGRKRGSDPAELRRIASILQRAADEITGNPS